MVHLGDADGIVDGGHTAEIIKASKAAGTCPEQQVVKLEILTGIPAQMASDINGGLNTSVQVDDASLMNLDREFEWVKDAHKNNTFKDQISYK